MFTVERTRTSPTLLGAEPRSVVLARARAALRAYSSTHRSVPDMVLGFGVPDQMMTLVRHKPS